MPISCIASTTIGFSFPGSAANLVQERLGHLAAGAVMDANKQDTLFHGLIYFDYDLGWQQPVFSG